MKLIIYIHQSIVNDPILQCNTSVRSHPSLHVKGNVRHGLHASRQRNLLMSAHQALRREHYRFHARSANLIDRGADGGLREVGKQGRLSRWGLPSSALANVPHVYLFDLLFGDSGPFDRGLHAYGPQFGGGEGGQRAEERPHRGAHC